MNHKSIDFQELNNLIEQGYIAVRKHPETELYIYNYTAKAQYENYWNYLTINCRGLILDAEQKIVARPFAKFFNLEQHQPTEIPQESFEVYAKLDGSLGILYWLEDRPFIATRGSFISEQAIAGTKILYSKYNHLFKQLDKNHSYLFEIIYPENRIVVDYGDIADLYLLAIIETSTGNDLVLKNIGFPLVEKYDGIKDLDKLKELEQTNQEGFVIKFESGFRVKLKFAEYVRLHRLITGISEKTIWEYLCLGESFQELLEKVPDEFYDWVEKTKEKLEGQFQLIEKECLPHLEAAKKYPTRKEIAEYFQKQTYPGILFAMLDNKDYHSIIWRIVKPKGDAVFKQDLVF